jgi:kynurenine formamidase
MKTQPLVLLGLVVLLGSARGLEADDAPFEGGRWIDLTHPFSEETLYWPTAQRFELETEFHGHTDKGYFYSAHRYCASEHGGTHVDAPIHFAEGRDTLDEIPITRLVGPAAVIDVSSSVGTNADYEISVADIESWESEHGRLAEGAIVLFNTGFGRYWPDAAKYLGTDERGADAVAKLHFPGLHPEAARWLVEKRSINAVGLDTASIDHGQSTHYESHCILFDKNIPAFENVAQLDKLPATGAHVLALPMKIKGGSGGPVRIVAWIREQ